MTKSVTSLLITLSLAFALPSGAADAASRQAKDLLKYIPADTPYVFASQEPLPNKLADKFEPTVDEVLLAYQRVIRYAMAEKLVALSAEEGGAEEAEKLQGLVNEVLTLMSVKGIRDAGIERDSVFAFYGNGLLPVIRLELKDAEAFDATIARIEARSEQSLATAAVGDESYRYIAADGIRFVIATLDGYAVLTLVPENFAAGWKGRAIICRRATSLRRSRKNTIFLTISRALSTMSALRPLSSTNRRVWTVTCSH